jgi:hypothetical protein
MIIDKITLYLREWIQRFMTNKDLIFRKIKEMHAEDSMVIVNNMDGSGQGIFICPFIESPDDCLAQLKDHDNCSLVVYNTRENFKALLQHWEKFSSFKRHFNIQFVNPFSQTEKRWAVFPQTHALMTEKSGLETGLRALFNNVEPITKDKLSKVLK